MRLICTVILLSLYWVCTQGQKQKAREFLKKFNKEAPNWAYDSAEADWNYLTNMNNENLQKKYKDKFGWWYWNQTLIAKQFDISELDPLEVRQFQLMLRAAPDAKNDSVDSRIYQIQETLEQMHSFATIQNNKGIITTVKGAKLHLNQIGDVMKKSDDLDELQYVWEGWRKVTGSKMRKMYAEMVRLQNIAAKDSNMADIGEYYRGMSEVDNLEKVADQLFKELKPLYDEIHAYVRFRLSKLYPDLVHESEPIPAHLLRKITPIGWTNIFKKIKPYGKDICYIN